MTILPLRTIIFLLTALGSGALAQEAGATFEVASIRLNTNPLARAFNIPLPGGGINYRGDSLMDLIAAGWRIDPGRIVGGPSWAGSTRYDIRAKAPEEAVAGLSAQQTLETISQMVRSLVLERFHAAIHMETRELPIFVLVPARKDGKLGPAIKEPDPGSCQPLDLSSAPAAFADGKFPPQMCGAGFLLYGGKLLGSGVDLGQLAEFLTRIAGRTVVDKTGLNRKFDLEMAWPASLGRPSVSPDDSDTSLFSVLEEQLGLKLESRKGPVDILVIDHADPVSEN